MVSGAGVAWLRREKATYESDAGASARTMAAEGRKLTGTDYIDALRRVAAFRRRSAELFAEVDLVLTPTAAALSIGAQLAVGFGADAWLLDFARDVSRVFPPPPLPVMKG